MKKHRVGCRKGAHYDSSTATGETRAATSAEADTRHCKRPAMIRPPP
jgi:hypothetical protein